MERRRRGHNEPVCATPGSAHDDALLGTHRPCKICSWRREHSLQSQRPVWPSLVRRQQQRRPLGSSVVRPRSTASVQRRRDRTDAVGELRVVSTRGGVKVTAPAAAGFRQVWETLVIGVAFFDRSAAQGLPRVVEVDTLHTGWPTEQCDRGRQHHQPHTHGDRRSNGRACCGSLQPRVRARRDGLDALTVQAVRITRRWATPPLSCTAHSSARSGAGASGTRESVRRASDRSR